MKTALFAAMALSLTGSAPALALPALQSAPAAAELTGVSETGHGRDRGWGRGDWDRGYRGGGYYRNSYYGERGYDGPQQWRGEDGRYYCRRADGTTGLIVGGAVGGVIGHEIAGRRGDRTLGTILGMAGGALLGREIDRGGSRCR